MNWMHFSLQEWLDCLENRHTQEIQLGLSRVDLVALALGVKTWEIPVITVAGTNGKGSTVAALEALYTQAGYRVGTYTSPHLIAFNERIRINQHPVSDEALCRAFCIVEQGRGQTHLTYFETTTLAALLLFKQSLLDVIILEVGMGGRHDATNAVDSDLAIVTTVDLDHQAFLGETKEAIGHEKAGIFRASKPCIYADLNPPQSLIECAQELSAELKIQGKDYLICTTTEQLTVLYEGKTLVQVPCPQLHVNAVAAAIIASHLLRERLAVDEGLWESVARLPKLAGRQQVVRLPQGVTVVLDVAHNPQAAQCLARWLQQQPIQGAVHAVFSALSDKNVPGVLTPLRERVNHWYLAQLDHKRAASAKVLLHACHDALQISPLGVHDPISAYEQALAHANPGDWVVVYGSFVMVGAIASHLDKPAGGLMQSNESKQRMRLKHFLAGAGIFLAALLVFLPAMKKSGGQLEEKINLAIRLPEPPALPVVSVPEKEALFQRVKVAQVTIESPKQPDGLLEVAQATSISKPPVAITALAQAKPAVGSEKKEEYAVQVASFSEQDNATTLVRMLRKQGYQVTVQQARTAKGPVYKVLVGAVSGRVEAARLQRQLAEKTQMNGFVVKTGVS